MLSPTDGRTDIQMDKSRGEGWWRPSRKYVSTTCRWGEQGPGPDNRREGQRGCTARPVTGAAGVGTPGEWGEPASRGPDGPAQKGPPFGAREWRQVVGQRTGPAPGT